MLNSLAIENRDCQISNPAVCTQFFICQTLQRWLIFLPKCRDVVHVQHCSTAVSLPNASITTNAATLVSEESGKVNI